MTDPQRPCVLVTSTSSDAHTWNLVFLQLLLEELGWTVVNLGACVPVGTVVEECLAHQPVLVVVASLNGHGGRDGLRLIAALRDRPELAGTPVVIGGLLDVAGGAGDGTGRVGAALSAAGYDAVFGTDGPQRFRRYVVQLATRRQVPVGER